MGEPRPPLSEYRISFAEPRRARCDGRSDLAAFKSGACQPYAPRHASCAQLDFRHRLHNRASVLSVILPKQGPCRARIRQLATLPCHIVRLPRHLNSSSSLLKGLSAAASNLPNSHSLQPASTTIEGGRMIPGSRDKSYIVERLANIRPSDWRLVTEVCDRLRTLARRTIRQY